MSYLVLPWALPSGVSIKEMELSICRSISFIYPSFASLKYLVCQPPILGLTSTARHPSPAVIHPKSPPYTQSSHTRSSHHETPKLLESYQQGERGLFSKKRVENERRKSHSPKELQTRSSNKRPNSLSKHESISLHLFDIPQDQNLVKFQSFMDLHSAWQYR